MVLNDERVEPSFGLAVPAAVWQLLAEQPVDDASDVLAEVGADRRDLPVDARFDLAGKEGVVVHLRRPAISPRHAVADKTHSLPRFSALGIQTQITQQQ